MIQKDKLCECGSVLLQVEFRENQNRESISGCIMCDDDMESLLATR
jgi:DNA topoisomerase-3